MSVPERTYAYYQAVFQETPKPFAFVDLDYFDENLRQIKCRAGEKRIRVASKSVRCASLLRRILSFDSQYQGIMAYHAAEAVFLSQNGFDDILVAYPFWDAVYIEAVANELKKGKSIYAMVDCEAHVQRFNQAGEAHGVQFPLCLDVDMSSNFFGLYFGVHRSGLDSAQQVAQIAAFMDSQPHVKLMGLMGYEAQIAGIQDHTAGKALQNMLVPTLKMRSQAELRARREAVVKAAGKERLRFVNAGGTGSLESSIQEAWVTEVTVGSGFYAPTLFDGYNHFKHLPAAAFAIEITRQPREHLYTCLGGGYVASGSAGKEKLPQPYLPIGANLLDNEGTGEVQTPVEYRGSQPLTLGDPIFFRHAKAGELCERFNQLHLVSQGKIVEIVPTYRGEGQCFM